MAASMTACGDSEDSSSKKSKKSDDSEVSQTEDSKPADESKEEDGSDSSADDQQISNPESDRLFKFYTELDAQYKQYGTFKRTERRGEAQGLVKLTDGHGLANVAENGEKHVCLFDEKGTVIDLLDLSKGLSYEYTGDDGKKEILLDGFFYYDGGDLFNYLRNTSEKEEMIKGYYEYKVSKYDLMQLDMNGDTVRKIVFNDPNTNSNWGIKSKDGNGDFLGFTDIKYVGADTEGNIVVSCEMAFRVIDEAEKAEYDNWKQTDPATYEAYMKDNIPAYYKNKEGEKALLYFAKGSDKPEIIPNISDGRAHGDGIDVSGASYITSYKNKMYFEVNDKVYSLDTTDLSWHETQFITDASRDIFIGRYWFTGGNLFGETKKPASVYDAETDTFVDNIPFVQEVIENYRGGDSVVIPASIGEAGKATLCEVKLPCGDGADDDIRFMYASDTPVRLSGYKLVKQFDEKQYDYYKYGYYKTANGWAVISATHYAFEDDYGVYLQSFEKGSADEKTVFEFGK